VVNENNHEIRHFSGDEPQYYQIYRKIDSNIVSEHKKLKDYREQSRRRSRISSL
jgi:hypothetical protein